MEVTIDEALRRGIHAQNEGRFQEAERIYRSILQSSPQHGDANHNLGVLAVHFGKIDLALPHFKTALEANANQEQYWVSYIEGLIRFGQLESARQVLAQGRQRGLKGDKVDQLEQQANGDIHDSLVEHKKIDKLQTTVDKLSQSLYKHIKFIDSTYDGLKNPIEAARKWLRK